MSQFATSPTQHTILIVDDNPEDREFYRRVLRRDPLRSYTILEASTAREGLALWHQHRPDILLLDYRLPDLNGLEVLALLQSPVQSLPVQPPVQSPAAQSPAAQSLPVQPPVQSSAVQPSAQPSCLPVVMLTGLGNEKVAVQSIKAGAQDYLVKGQITPEGLYLAIHGALEAVQLHVQLQQRIERERVVSQLMRQIHRSFDLNEILQTTVDEVRAFLQTDRVVVFRLQSEGWGTVITESVGPDWTPLLSTSYCDPCFNAQYIEPFRQGLVTAKADIHDESIEPCHRELLASLQVRANLVVPILQDDRLWGMLIAHHCAAPREWQTLEVDLLKDLASQVGIALKQAELYQQAQTELAERKRTEAALRESEERYQQLVEVCPDGIFVQIDGRFVFANPAALGLFGANTLEDLLSKSIIGQVCPPYHDLASARMEQLRQGQPVPLVEEQLLRLDGTVADVEVAAIPLLYQGQSAALVAVRDVTERKRAEAVLRDSEERYRQLAENINVVFWIAELPERKVSYVSPAYERLWGLDPQMLCGGHQLWVDLLHPDDREAADRAFADKALQGEFDEEYRIILPDGRVRWVRDRCFPLYDTAGQAYRLLGFAEDITDRKQAERQLRDSQHFVQQIAEATPGILYVYDLIEQRNVYVNQQVTTLLGYTTEQVQEMGTTLLSTLFHPEDFARFPDHIAQFQSAQEGEILELEYRMRHANGEWRWLHDRSVLFSRSADGTPQQVLGISQDITERKRTEQALRQSQENLRIANERFELAAAAVNGLIYDWDLEQDRVERTEGLTRLLGYPLSEAPPTSEWWREKIHPEDLQRILDAVAVEGLAGDRHAHEYRVLNQANQYRYVFDQSIVVARNLDGYPTRVVGSTIDITDRKQTEAALRDSEEALRASEAQFRTIANAAPALVWVCSPTGEATFMNERWYEYTGQSWEESQGFGWTSTMHPDDAAQILPHWERCCQTGELYEGEVRYRRQDGVYRWHRFRALPQHNRVGAIEKWVGCSIDTDDAKQSEAVIAANEARLRGFVEANIVGILYGDIHGGIREANEELLRMVGYTRQDLERGKLRWTDITPAEYLPLDAQAIAEARATGACTPYEKEYIRQDGSRVPVLIGYSLVGETREESVAFILDLSQRKAAEAALVASEERFRQMAENISDIFWMIDLEQHHVLYISPSFRKVWGRSREPLYQDWDARYAYIHPDDRARVGAIVSQAVQTDGFDLEYRILRPDRTIRYLRERGFIIPHQQDQPLRLLGVTQDITDRKQAELERERRLAQEQQYASRLQGLAAAGLLINSATSIDHVLDVITQQAAQIIGCHQAATGMSINQQWTQAITSIYLSDRYAQWRTYSDQPNGTGIYSLVCELNRPLRLTQAELEAHPRWQGFGKAAQHHPPMRGWLAVPLVGRDGQNMGLIQLSDKHEGEFTAEDEAILVQLAQMAAVAIENTRLYAAEQNARTEAERANRIKDEFLAVLSHELRSPLNPILGWTKLMQSRSFSASRTAEALATIERNAKLQIQLIDDLLDTAKILRGKLSMNITSVDLAFVVESALETVRAAAQAKAIRICPVLPQVGMVSGDSARLQQIVWNLLSNAVKFTPNEGRVDILLERLDQEAQLTIQDTGKGIDPQFLPYLFESFRQEDASTTRKYGGLGLGLAIVRHLVEAHGGTIWAESAGEGQGATFTLRLPLLSPAFLAEMPDAPPDPELDLTGIRVLAVDDEQDARELLSAILTQYHAEVFTVASAAEALTALPSFQPDVLISDIGMPTVDGYALIQQVRTLPPEKGGQTPALALTAHTREEDQQRNLSAGFQRHLSKPVEPILLVQTIAHLLQSLQSQT